MVIKLLCPGGWCSCHTAPRPACGDSGYRLSAAAGEEDGPLTREESRVDEVAVLREVLLLHLYRCVIAFFSLKRKKAVCSKMILTVKPLQGKECSVQVSEAPLS